MKIIMEGWRKHLAEQPKKISEAALGFSQLAKSPQRMSRFIEKLENEEPFETLDGEEVVFVKDDRVIDILKQMLDMGEISDRTARRLRDGEKFILPTKDGRVFRLTQLSKTSEFGGKGGDFYIKKEIAARGQLESLINQALQAANTDAITVEVLNGKGERVAVYDDVIGVQGTDKANGIDPKSDFQLKRKDKKPPVFISHKDGTTAKNFGQWSGVTGKAGAPIANHKEVKEFVELLEPHLNIDAKGNKTYPPGLSVGKIIDDPQLRLMSIYGPDYKPSGAGSVNNVDIVAQGLFSLKTVGVTETPDDDDEQVVYTLSANHLIARLDPKPSFGELYTPALISRFATRRNNFGIRGLRATIYPAGGRNVHGWIGGAPKWWLEQQEKKRQK